MVCPVENFSRGVQNCIDCGKGAGYSNFQALNARLYKVDNKFNTNMHFSFFMHFSSASLGTKL